MSKQPDQTFNPPPSPVIQPWGRPLAIATAVLFCISFLFPIVAALSKDTAAFPNWWGVLDVCLAFLLAILAFVIYGLAQGKVTGKTEQTTYRAYRVLIHGIFVMMLVFFLFGDRIIWINGLTGIAWRSWLLLYCLPAWITVLGAPAKPGGSTSGEPIKPIKI